MITKLLPLLLSLLTAPLRLIRFVLEPDYIRVKRRD